MIYASYTARGAKHAANEDRLLVASVAPKPQPTSDERSKDKGSVKTPTVFAVFDGVGGAAHGGETAQTAADALAEAFAGIPADINGNAFDKFIASALAACEQSVAPENEEEAKEGFAAGAGICFGNGGEAVIFHIGDVRVFRFRNGNVTRMTKDHSLAEFFRDNNPGEEVPARIAHVITRCLGQSSENTFEVQLPTMTLPGDIYLICSDGLWEFLPDEDIASVFTQSLETVTGDSSTAVSQLALEHALSTLATMTLQRGSYDDTTATAILIEDDLKPIDVTEQFEPIKLDEGDEAEIDAFAPKDDQLTQ